MMIRSLKMLYFIYFCFVFCNHYLSEKKLLFRLIPLSYELDGP